MIYTKHFTRVLHERSINENWVERALQTPDLVEEHEDGTCHFLKQITEHDNRWLRVIINVNVTPNRYVTVFFDRRMRRIQ